MSTLVKAFPPLRNDPDVFELMSVLNGAKMEVPQAEFFSMLSTVDTLEAQMKNVFQELRGIHDTLKAQNRKNPVVAAFTKAARNLQAKAVALWEKIGELRQAVVEGAKRALAAFKEKGVTALNGIMRFFKVKPTLNSMQNILAGAIKIDEKAISKIAAMAAEYHETGAHLSNIGRIFIGKETVEKHENGKLAKALQVPFKADRKLNIAMRKGMASLIGKLNRLEQAAKPKRPSLDKQLAEGRKLMEAQTPKPIDHGKKREVTI